MSEHAMVIIGGVICDPSGTPLDSEQAFLRTEALRALLRGRYEDLVASGQEDAEARRALGEQLELLIAVDRLAGGSGDPLADTAEGDWT